MIWGCLNIFAQYSSWCVKDLQFQKEKYANIYRHWPLLRICCLSNEFLTRCWWNIKGLPHRKWLSAMWFSESWHSVTSSDNGPRLNLSQLLWSPCHCWCSLFAPVNESLHWSLLWLELDVMQNTDFIKLNIWVFLHYLLPFFKNWQTYSLIYYRSRMKYHL